MGGGRREGHGRDVGPIRKTKTIPGGILDQVSRSRTTAQPSNGANTQKEGPEAPARKDDEIQGGAPDASPQTANELGKAIEGYQNVFHGIGMAEGEYEITLKPDAIPVVHPPRRVPQAFKGPLKRELDRLVGLGIISPVTHRLGELMHMGAKTKWGNPAVYRRPRFKQGNKTPSLHGSVNR